MRRAFAVNEIEGRKFADLMDALRRAERDVKIAFAFLIAQHGMTDATLVSLEGSEVTVEVPE